MSRYPSIGDHRGFSLIEVILAIGILAAMTLTMSQMNEGILNAQQRARGRNDARHYMTITVSKLMDDFRMAFVADKTLQGTNRQFLTGFKGSEKEVHFSTLSAVHYVKNKADTDSVQVSYSLKKSVEFPELQALHRRSTDFLLPQLDRGGQSYVVLDQVVDWDLSYFDSNKREWVKTWDTEGVSSAGRLPQMVKVQLTLQESTPDEDDESNQEPLRRTYDLIVPIPMYALKVSY